MVLINPMLAAASNTFPLTEMEGIIPGAENFCRVICYLCLEGQQSLMICLTPTEIIGVSSTTSKNREFFYMLQCNDQEKKRNGLEVNCAQ